MAYNMGIFTQNVNINIISPRKPEHENLFQFVTAVLLGHDADRFFFESDHMLKCVYFFMHVLMHCSIVWMAVFTKFVCNDCRICQSMKNCSGSDIYFVDKYRL
jgi:hypothetical protein